MRFPEIFHHIFVKDKIFHIVLLYVFVGIGTYVLGGRAFLPYLQMFLVVLTLQFFPILFYVCFVLFGAYIVLFFGVGLLYGELNYGMLISFLNTNVNESKEFLIFVLKHYWLQNLILLLVFLFLLTRMNKVVFHLDWRGKLKVLALLAIYSIIAVFTYAIPNAQPFHSIYSNPVLKLVHNLNFYWNSYEVEVEDMESVIKEPPDWHYESVKPKYKNYVIVIGESARKDYMNSYGFKLQNTPFLSKTKGLLIDGYVSAGSYTALSLRGSFLLSKQKSNDNIISLANGAGFVTTWISNQGFSGWKNNYITAMANESHKMYFSQRNGYEFSKVISDDVLYPYIDKALDENVGDRHRLIIIHIMGSHINYCSRIKKISFHYLNDDMSCYVSSLYETDKFLETVVEKLKQRNESWSLIYFSDHGLNHSTREKQKVTLLHSQNSRYKSSVDVPFVKLSSDDTERRYVKVARSAFNFLKGFCSWTGIKVKEINYDNYDFFGNDPDKNIKTKFNVKKNDVNHDVESPVDYYSLPEDPVVDE